MRGWAGKNLRWVGGLGERCVVEQRGFGESGAWADESRIVNSVVSRVVLPGLFARFSFAPHRVRSGKHIAFRLNQPSHSTCYGLLGSFMWHVA